MCIDTSVSQCGTATVTGLCPGSSAIRCCPSSGGTQPFGPDVSDYQGAVDWKAVKTFGAGFAIVKATEGTTWIGNTFAANWAGMKSAGIPVRGAYHFAHPKNGAVPEAQHFVDIVGSFGPGEFAVLDIEAADSQSPSTVAQYSRDWCDEVMRLTGLPKNRVWIYTGNWFWSPQAGGSSIVADHPLWASAYSSSEPSVAGWDKWTMWQYTDAEKISGISGGVDASRFGGTQAELEALVEFALSWSNATIV